MRDLIEKSLDVRIEYYSIALSVEFEHPLDGLMAVSAGDESEGRVMKPWFEDRCQKSTNDFLGDAVANHGYRLHDTVAKYTSIQNHRGDGEAPADESIGALCRDRLGDEITVWFGGDDSIIAAPPVRVAARFPAVDRLAREFAP